MPLAPGEGLLEQRKIDRRWIVSAVRRSSRGGADDGRLEVTVHRATGTCEAPRNCKSNGGTPVIDDFGRAARERRGPVEPLDRAVGKRYDYLQLPSGKTIQVPFDQLIVFSTNLEPKDLVDERFCGGFRTRSTCPIRPKSNFANCFSGLPRRWVWSIGRSRSSIDPAALSRDERPFRYCHSRDLMLQMRSVCG